ncbi:hypothetical protein JTB14_011828 [Gonioctena quinquepunctata]|nr:hypothetical protein JTB14_011828 [Gonioctena quinquepunctata]
MKTGHIEVNTPEIEKQLSGFVSSVEVDTSLKVSKKRGRPRKNLEKMKIEQASENKKCVDVHIESNETETTHSRSDMEQENSFPEKVDESTKVDQMEIEHIEAPSFSTEHLSTPKVIKKMNMESTKEVIGLQQKQGIDSYIESDLKQEVSLLEKVDQMKTRHIEVNTPEIEKQFSGFVSSVEVDTPSKVLKKRGKSRKNIEKMKIEQAKEVVELKLVDTAFENKKCVDVNIGSNETETTHFRSDMEQEYSFPEKVDESTKVDQLETEHIEESSFSTEHLSTPKVKKRPRNNSPNEEEQLINNTSSSDINKSDNNPSDKQFPTPISASDCLLQVIRKRGKPRKNLEKLNLESPKEVIGLQAETVSEKKQGIESDPKQEVLLLEEVDESTKAKADQMDTNILKSSFLSV